MDLFVVIGRSPNRTELIKKVATKRAFNYSSTKDYPIGSHLGDVIARRLDSGQNLFLNVESRTQEVFNNSFLNKLKNHFVTFVVLAGEKDTEADEFKDWPDYFVFHQHQQSEEFISNVLGEIVYLTLLFSQHKPFPKNVENIDLDLLLKKDQADALKELSIPGLYNLMLSIIKSKSIGNCKLNLRDGVNFLMHFNSIPYKTMPRGIPVYRIRFNKTERSEPILYKNIIDLWHPPKNKARMGRFNRDKQPVLYTADHILTSFYETFNHDYHGKEGFVTGLGCIVDQDLTVGYISSMDVHLPPGQNSFYNHFINFFKDNITDQERLIKNFLGNYINSHSFFTPNFSYEITNLISDTIYKGTQMQAFMYPSTKLAWQYNNIVFFGKDTYKHVIPTDIVVYSFSFPRPREVSLKPLYRGTYVSSGRITYEKINN